MADVAASSPTTLENAERPSYKRGAGGPHAIGKETLRRDAFSRGDATEARNEMHRRVKRRELGKVNESSEQDGERHADGTNDDGAGHAHGERLQADALEHAEVCIQSDRRHRGAEQNLRRPEV